MPARGTNRNAIEDQGLFGARIHGHCPGSAEYQLPARFAQHQLYAGIALGDPLLAKVCCPSCPWSFAPQHKT